MNKIDLDHVKSLLIYDPETGIFTWKPRPESMFPRYRSWKTWNTRFAGKRAGAVRELTNGYKRRSICLNHTKHHFEHRLAWVYMTGGQPPNQIDHYDRDGTNNRWSNLRDGTKTNHLNRSALVSNTSGFTGVCWNNQKCKWQSYVEHDKKRYHVGFFDDKNDAALAVLDLRASLGFDAGHGQPRPS